MTITNRADFFNYRIFQIKENKIKVLILLLNLTLEKRELPHKRNRVFATTSKILTPISL